MRSNMFPRKKIKKWLAAAGLFLCLLVTAVPVFAEEEVTTAATETTAETTAAKETEAETTKAAEPGTTKAEEPETSPAEKKEEKTSEPEAALPLGNLTLVDDVITATDGHREFLTVVSREGSYFYIVIDRDTQGAGNVYFLNLVDEQDLYKLTGEKKVTITETEESTQLILSPQKTEQESQPAETETISEEEAAAQKQKSLIITVAVFAAIGVGVVIYLLKKKKSGQQAKTQYDLSEFDDDDE